MTEKQQTPATLDECFEAARLLQDVAVLSKPPQPDVSELLEAAKALLDFDDTNVICDVHGEMGAWQSMELEAIINRISIAARAEQKGGE